MCPWLNLSGSDRSESSNPSGVVLVWRPAREATIWLFEMNMMFLFSSYVFLKMVYPITQTVFLVSDGSVHQTFWYVRLQKRLNIDGLKLNFLQAFIIPSRWILFNLGTQSFHSWDANLAKAAGCIRLRDHMRIHLSRLEALCTCGWTIVHVRTGESSVTGGGAKSRTEGSRWEEGKKMNCPNVLFF